MTVLSRGARVRRGGRRPGWLLLTALLVLAIGASSALVFTDRVELLKLAVILALWAAVVAAFVSVIYRRQSDVDQARARDLKLVYDLQLDREISARREYELTVESQLRRELASELRAQAADEVAALRSELAALRTNLEILFETELTQRPALETERTTVRGYSEWADTSDHNTGDWVSRNRVPSVRAEATSNDAEDTSIIDVPEEPVPRQPVADTAATDPVAEAYRTRENLQAPEAGPFAGEYRGSHWRPADSDEEGAAPEQSDSRNVRRPRRKAETPSPTPEVSPEHEQAPPVQPEEQPSSYPPAAEAQAPGPAAPQWQPVDVDGQKAQAVNGAPSDQTAPEAPVQSPERSRHAGPTEDDADSGGRYETTEQHRSSRHSVDQPIDDDGADTLDAVDSHRDVEVTHDEGGAHTDGQSVADLLARLQAEPAGGGRRRRRAR